MEKQVFLRKFTSKAGKPCTALVVKFGGGREMLFFDKNDKYMALLDLKPSEYYALAEGDYEIK